MSLFCYWPLLESKGEETVWQLLAGALGPSYDCNYCCDHSYCFSVLVETTPNSFPSFPSWVSRLGHSIRRTPNAQFQQPKPTAVHPKSILVRRKTYDRDITTVLVVLLSGLMAPAPKTPAVKPTTQDKDMPTMHFSKSPESCQTSQTSSQILHPKSNQPRLSFGWGSCIFFTEA